MPNANIYLPYFKQGDDFANCSSNAESVEEALENHAEMLEAAAAQLRKIKSIVAGHGVTIDGDTHSIWIDADKEIIDTLVQLKLVFLDEEDEEYDDMETD